ncbi:MAG: hypothetical protein ACI9O6_003358 [Glaciecola sp.]|jgi:hypothetical protein
MEYSVKKVIYFGKKTWFGVIDFEALNEKIQRIESEGWNLISITPASSFFGAVTSYSLLVELAIVNHGLPDGEK